MRRGSGYQLIVLGANADRLAASFVARLREYLDQIGDDLSAALTVLDRTQLASHDPTAPSVAVFFGSDVDTDAAEAAALMARAVPILPVVDDLERYPVSVPAVLQPINGLAVDPAAPNFAELTNLVLENLSLLRRSRRLFLSYRRYESSAIAQQLRVAFDGIGYDAFLDTSSVPKGDDFQSVLWHRLLDSDVMVVLDTHDFLGSRFTRAEIANASAMSVGILQVLWPGVTRSPHSHLAVPLQLSPADFDGERLTNASVERVTNETEALRARCLAARHTNLVLEFCNAAKGVGAAATVQPERYVLAELRGHRIAAIPAIGVPDVQHYHEASRYFSIGDVDEAVLLYDHRGMHPQWIALLAWLDDFLPVKGLRVTDTRIRLEAL